MDEERILVKDASKVDPNLLRMLNRGLEDIEFNRTVPHQEAMKEIKRIRKERHQERANIGVAVNA